MSVRAIFVSGLGALLGAQGASAKKDPLAAALGGGSGRAVRTDLGASGIEAAFKAARTDRARSMAAEIVGLLGTLASDAEQALAGLDSAKAEEDRCYELYKKRQAEVEDYLREYRQGLFCSGCQKSKSEIERRGDQFPHPGQHIVRPTEREIEAKERELGEGVNRLFKAWTQAGDRVKKLRGKIDDLLGQIPQGHALWCTASTYAANLAARARAQSAAELGTALRETEGRLDEATRRGLAAREAEARDKADRDKAALRTRVDQLRERMKSEERRSLQEEAGLAQARKEQSGRIAGYLDRPWLRRSLTLDPAYAVASRMAGVDALGGGFLMGGLPSQTTEPALPSVLGFIAEFRACDPGLVRTRN